MRDLLSLLGYPPGVFNGVDSMHCGATCSSMPVANSGRRLEQGPRAREADSALAVDAEEKTLGSPHDLLRRLLQQNEAVNKEGVAAAARLPWYDE